MPHCRQPPRHAGRLEAAGIEIGQVIPQGLRFGDGKAAACADQEFREIRQVAAIGIEGVFTGAPFRREHVEEQVGQFGV